MSELSDRTRRSVSGNVEQWTKVNTEYGDASAARTWASEVISWGQFGVTEESIGSPLGDVTGLDMLELGCGTAYFSAWLARRGARPVGLDPTPAQLATARRLQAETGIDFPLVEGAAEALPFPDHSFDMVVSEYGASLWADPYLWVPEATRVLRAQGRLVFLVPSTLVYLCAPDEGDITTSLQRSQFGMHHISWPGDPGTEYQISHGAWIGLLRTNGFEVEGLIGCRSDRRQRVPEPARRLPGQQ